MNVETGITIASAVLVPLLISFLAHYRWKKERERQEANAKADGVRQGRQSFHADIMEELRSIRQEYRQLKDKHEALMTKHADMLSKWGRIETELRNKLMLFESAHQQLPLPMWVKDSRGVMLAVNDAYELQFLQPRGYKRADYVGHKDQAVWPDDIATIFRQHDREVWQTGVTKVYDEEIELPGFRQKMRFMKYVRFAGDIKIGVAGVAFPLTSEELQENAQMVAEKIAEE